MERNLNLRSKFYCFSGIFGSGAWGRKKNLKQMSPNFFPCRILRLHKPGLGRFSFSWTEKRVTFEQARVRWASVYMILTFLAQQGGLTRLDYCFHVNAYKHLTAKGLPAAVIQLGLKSNPGSCKEALSWEVDITWARGINGEWKEGNGIFLCVGELDCNFWQY